MKKTLLLAMTLFMPFVSVFSDPIPISQTTLRHSGGSRTSIPSVTADLESGIITIDINRYLGNASVVINNVEGEANITNIAYISGHTAFTTNVSQLPVGMYTILIELEDGNTYTGSFNIVE